MASEHFDEFDASTETVLHVQPVVSNTNWIPLPLSVKKNWFLEVPDDFWACGGTCVMTELLLWRHRNSVLAAMLPRMLLIWERIHFSIEPVARWKICAARGTIECAPISRRRGLFNSLDRRELYEVAAGRDVGDRKIWRVVDDNQWFNSEYFTFTLMVAGQCRLIWLVNISTNHRGDNALSIRSWGRS
jgi:hypothetical protein